jgi:hypothetical protein
LHDRATTSTSDEERLDGSNQVIAEEQHIDYGLVDRNPRIQVRGDQTRLPRLNPAV